MKMGGILTFISNIKQQLVHNNELITQVYKISKNFSFIKIVISYRFLGAESENDNKNL